jgi:hypothetical protein
MQSLRNASLILSVLLIALSALPQEQPAKSKVVPVLTAEQIRAINEPRDRAFTEIFSDYAPYAPPSIANALYDARNIIAVVRVTHVTPPTTKGDPYEVVDMHIEQVLRGVPHSTEIHAESHWLPPPKNGFPLVGRPGLTPFDIPEPKVGHRYIVGYSIYYSDGGAYIPGAINLDYPDQDHVIAELKRFISIEESTTGENFSPFVSALDDQTPWIRNLSAQRLIMSDSCNAAPSCQQAVLAAANHLLHSKIPAERWEALDWLETVAAPIGDGKSGPNGLTPLANTNVRDIWAAAISDSNLMIGDRAFAQMEMYDFFRHSNSGECIEVVPALRKSARWTAEEAKTGIGGPGYGFGLSSGCIP